MITGASGGIGAATARRFAAAGERIAVHCRRSREAAEAVRDGLPGSGHCVVAGDVSTPEGAQELMDAAFDACGSIDVLVCNAGVAPSADNIHNPATADYRTWAQHFGQMSQTNFLGPAYLSWRFAHHLIERQEPGAIVNVGSRGAFIGEPDHPAYAASKAALHALGQSLAVALAPHRIQVASVAPGFVATERQRDRLSGDEGQRIRSQSPFGRVAEPEEIAEAVHWLASPEAAWCSGTILDANGASHLRV